MSIEELQIQNNNLLMESMRLKKQLSKQEDLIKEKSEYIEKLEQRVVDLLGIVSDCFLCMGYGNQKDKEQCQQMLEKELNK